MWSADIASGFAAASSAQAALVKAMAHSATQAIAGITKFSLDVMDLTFFDATRLRNWDASFIAARLPQTCGTVSLVARRSYFITAPVRRAHPFAAARMGPAPGV
jgi:hypothetical protein